MHRGSRWLVCLIVTAALVLPCLQAAAGTPPPIVNGQPVASLAPILKYVTPAVVNISSTTKVQVRNPFFDDPIFRQFFGGGVPRERIERSLGSGVIVNAAKGYVLTNNHVVNDADSIKVTLQDGRTFKAKVVGTDPDTDLAVLQIPAQKLTQLPMADSSKIQVGDFVIAVGNPFGLGQSVTYGIISALGRTGLGDTYQNFIQTDAAINPGNSGGALVNLKGQLVGINSMIYSPSGANAGIGFAIPSNLARRVMQQLIKYGKVRRGDLGIHVQKLTNQLASALHVAPDAGAVVTAVDPGSPAAQAGLKAGDLLHAINGSAIHDPQQLHNIEGLLPVGSAVQLSIRRNGSARTLSMHMASEKVAHASGAALDARLAGTELSDVRAGASARHAGIKVTRVTPGSRAARNGIEAGDVIVAANQRRTPNLAALKSVLAQHPSQLMLVLARGHGWRYVLAR